MKEDDASSARLGEDSHRLDRVDESLARARELDVVDVRPAAEEGVAELLEARLDVRLVERGGRGSAQRGQDCGGGNGGW
jgi:hypothetical protein